MIVQIHIHILHAEEVPRRLGIHAQLIVIVGLQVTVIIAVQLVIVFSVPKIRIVVWLFGHLVTPVINLIPVELAACYLVHV